MTYHKDVGEVSARYFAPDTVERATMRSGTVARFIAPGSATEGRYGLYEWNMLARSGGATPHFHKTFSESFYVISGTVRLYDGALGRCLARRLPVRAGRRRARIQQRQ